MGARRAWRRARSPKGAYSPFFFMNIMLFCVIHFCCSYKKIRKNLKIHPGIADKNFEVLK